MLKWHGACFNDGRERKRAEMLRISIMDSSDRLRIFRLEGMVIGRWVEELRDLCELALQQSQDVMVDLNDVSYIDREGIALLMSLRDRQVALLNPQPFVAELLKRPTN